MTPHTSPPAARAGPPPMVRLLMVCFVAVVLASGAGKVDAWPLTDWRLFAGLRRATEYRWAALAVDRTGTERPIDFSDLPRGYAGGAQVLARLRRLPEARVLAICEAWGRAFAREEMATVTHVRIARLRVSGRTGDVLDRELTFSCQVPA